jgi:prepilin-type N-terminal cleavage/methylation domain-containing protein
MKPVKNAFSLIEVLIVVLVIGILTTMAIPMFQGMAIKAKFTGMLTDVRLIQLAIDSYIQENPEWCFNEGLEGHETVSISEITSESKFSFLLSYDLPRENSDFEYIIQGDSRGFLSIAAATRKVHWDDPIIGGWLCMCEIEIKEPNKEWKWVILKKHPWAKYLNIPGAEHVDV